MQSLGRRVARSIRRILEVARFTNGLIEKAGVILALLLEEARASLGGRTSVMRDAGLVNVDLLKIDIEGAEWGVFNDPAFALRVRSFVGEIHVDISGHSIEAHRSVLEKDFAVTIAGTGKTDRYVVMGIRKGETPVFG